jgi:DNA-binding response OmpR family regulator
MSLNINEELYRSVRMVVGDTDQEFNKALSAALFPIGLRDISICQNGEQLRNAIAANVDVVVCNTALPGVEFHALAQDIRHQRVAGNPFIVLIATANKIDEAGMARILQSGVDDLLIKPIDSATLIRRIGAFAKGRKPFVITPGYIGPTRRNDRRDDGSDDDQVVEVPNTIRAKVALRQSAAEITKLIETGAAALGEKMASGGVKVIARLTKRLVDTQNDQTVADQSRRALGMLADKAAEIAMLHRNSRTTRYVAPIAERMAQLCRRAQASGNSRPPSVEVDLLQQLSDAAQIAATKQDAPETVPEIVKIVDGYLSKPEK